MIISDLISYVLFYGSTAFHNNYCELVIAWILTGQKTYNIIELYFNWEEGITMIFNPIA